MILHRTFKKKNVFRLNVIWHNEVAPSFLKKKYFGQNAIGQNDCSALLRKKCFRLNAICHNDIMPSFVKKTYFRQNAIGQNDSAPHF